MDFGDTIAILHLQVIGVPLASARAFGRGHLSLSLIISSLLVANYANSSSLFSFNNEVLDYIACPYLSGCERTQDILT